MAALLLMAALLAGCQKEEEEGTLRVMETEPAATYDWMAGESPVPNKRMGITRAGLNDMAHAVSPTGVYFLYRHNYIIDQTPPSPWILYVDDGSDMVIKLCGRPDCTHDTTDCNAYVEAAEMISYYEGHLYVVSDSTDVVGEELEHRSKLIQMDPDGSDRVEVIDFLEFAKENGGAKADVEMIVEGYCLFNTYGWGQTEDGQRVQDYQKTFLYKLDGSMEPKEVAPGGLPLYSCGDVLLCWKPNESKNGGENGSYWDWDLETGIMTYLTDHPGQPGWFGETEAYYFKGGAVWRLDYETGQEEIVIDTGLEGDHYAICLPDCLIVVEDAVMQISDKNLYFYNWAFELVDTVQIEYPDEGFMLSQAVIAETAERIILSDSHKNERPSYYIDKSELGTGDVELHPFELPELWED